MFCFSCLRAACEAHAACTMAESRAQKPMRTSKRPGDASCDTPIPATRDPGTQRVCTLEWGAHHCRLFSSSTSPATSASASRRVLRASGKTESMLPALVETARSQRFSSKNTSTSEAGNRQYRPFEYCLGNRSQCARYCFTIDSFRT